MQGQLPNTFDASDMLSYAVCTRGPTILGPERKNFKFKVPRCLKNAIMGSFMECTYKNMEAVLLAL